MNDLGCRLKELRKNSGLTQEKLAESIGVSYQAVSKWETGASSPDLSLIVPLARLLEVSTDELLGHTRRSEFENMWHKSQKADLYEQLKVEEAALTEYQHDKTFLYRRAVTEYFIAQEIDDEERKRHYYNISQLHFKSLIEKYPDFDSAVSMLVKVLSGIERYDEAVLYAYKLPYRERNRMLKYCLRGDKLKRHCQEMIHEALRDLINELSYENYINISPQIAEDIIKTVVSDGNYLYYYYNLMIIWYNHAKGLAAEKRYDEAIDSLQKSLAYVRKHKNLKGKGILPFTVPVFDMLTYDTSELDEHVHPIEDFYGMIGDSCFDEIRDDEKFIALQKDE